MDNIGRKSNEEVRGGVQMKATTVQPLLFLDDLMLVAVKDEDVESNLRTW